MAFLMFSIFYELDVKNIQPFAVLAYIEFLLYSELSVATIKNYLSSLKTRLNNLGINTAAFNSPKITTSIQSIEKNAKIPFKNKPILVPSQIRALYLQAERLPLKAFIRVAILLAYMAFLRISNLAPKSIHEFDILRDIRRGDVTVTKNGINIFIRWAKSLQKYNQTATIPLFAIPN
jgi:integrase